MNTLKKITSIFLVFALFTNCYSHRKIENNPSKMVGNNKYHIDLKNGNQMTAIVDLVSTNTVLQQKKRKSP
jgi:cell division protein YceG involved in septum cleavage